MPENFEVLKKKIRDLEAKVRFLKHENEKLLKEVGFLKTHPSILQGLKGEELVFKITKGTATKYAAKYDMLISDEIRIEIKYSKINIPNPQFPSPTRRWNWSKPNGIFDKGKNYDFLILLGEKDERFPDQYVDSSPYICFLIPYKNVLTIMSKGSTIGGMIQLNTNLRTARAEKSRMIKKFIVSMEKLEELIFKLAQLNK